LTKNTSSVNFYATSRKSIHHRGTEDTARGNGFAFSGDAEKAKKLILLAQEKREK
jgi:hypothetical protein